MTKAMLVVMKEHTLASNSVFIGATNLLSGEADFKSLDGLSLPDDLEWTESNYYDNPYDGIRVRCLALTDAGKLADVGCSQVLAYFCQKSAHNCTSTDESSKSSNSYYSYYLTNDDDDNVENSTPAVDQCEGNGYALEPRTGSCYKFHRAAATWRSALSTCNAEGGHLAIINSRIESTVLKELYKQNNYTVITGTPNPYYASIGFRKYDGQWATIQGQTLAEAGFDEWSVGEPNDLGEENCGTMYWDGLLNDAPCDSLYPYICEKKPEENNISCYFTRLVENNRAMTFSGTIIDYYHDYCNQSKE